MKTRFVSFLVFSFLLAKPLPASATLRTCVSDIHLFSSSQTDGSATAHILELDISSCSQACSPNGFPNKRAYIEFGDTQLYAKALAAEATGNSYLISFDDASTAKGSSVHQTYACKVLSIFQ